MTKRSTEAVLESVKLHAGGPSKPTLRRYYNDGGRFALLAGGGTYYWFFIISDISVHLEVSRYHVSPCCFGDFKNQNKFSYKRNDGGCSDQSQSYIALS